MTNPTRYLVTCGVLTYGSYIAPTAQAALALAWLESGARDACPTLGADGTVPSTDGTGTWEVAGMTDHDGVTKRADCTECGRRETDGAKRCPACGGALGLRVA